MAVPKICLHIFGTDTSEHRAKPVREEAKLPNGHCEACRKASSVKPVRYDLRRGPLAGGVLRSLRGRQHGSV